MDKSDLLILAVSDCIFSDDPDMLALWKAALESRGLKTRFESVSGDKLLDQAKHSNPSLVLLGHRSLCGPWGSDLVKVLKTNTETCHIPIVMIESVPDIDRIAKECGADAYILLPAGAKEIYDTVAQLIGTLR